MKRVLILMLVFFNLVACSNTNEGKEEISLNTDISTEDTSENLKNEDVINEESKNTNIINEDIKKNKDIKTEICGEITKYQQNDELYYQLLFTYDRDGNLSLSDFFASDNSLEKLKKFNKALKSTFDYNELNN